MYVFDIVITNFIDYDSELELDTLETIYYYAVAIKKINDDYKIIKSKLNREAIELKELSEKLKINILNNPPLVRALYMGADEDKKVPDYLVDVLNKVFCQLDNILS